MFLIASGWDGGINCAAGRGHNGARTTPAVETLGRAGRGLPPPCFGFSGRDASPAAGSGAGDTFQGSPAPVSTLSG